MPRADLERELYRKRAKIKVRFVELTDTIPVQGPETEIEDNLVFADFLALLDERERQVVLLLPSGITKAGHVAGALGYKSRQSGLQAPGPDPQEGRRLFRGSLTGLVSRTRTGQGGAGSAGNSRRPSVP